MTARRPSLRELLGAGVHGASRYTGTLLVVHAVMMLVTGALVLAVAVLLSQMFSHLPYWDDAVDGDLVAIIECVRYGRTAFLAIVGIAFGALVLWQLASWFVVGGLYGVLVQRPEGRREVARVFGATGATTYFAYARLAILQLPAYAGVLFALGTGLGIAAPSIDHALTLPELLVPLLLAVLPALLLLHLAWTVGDYVRVELALRQDSHDPGVLRTYARTFAYVVKHPITLVHGAIGWLLWLAITVAYMYVASGHPMYGAEGAITIYVARQGIALLRTATRVGILAGQVELGRTRELPARRTETIA